MNLIIDKHSTVDKSFNVHLNDITLQVDYDDVDHVKTDAIIETVKHIVKNYWNDDVFHYIMRLKLIRQYTNDNNLHTEYPTIDLWLESNGYY